MANVSPSQVFPNYELLAAGNHAIVEDSILIPVSSLAALNPEEADPETGNAGEVIRAINFQGLAAIAELPAAQRPTKWSIARSQLAGVAGSTEEVTQTMTLTSTFTVSGADAVASPEPTA